MRWTIVLLLCACAGSPAPAESQQPVGETDPDFNAVLVADRPYTLREPTSYVGDPTPLVVTLHGLGSTSNQQLAYSGLATLSQTRNFFVAAPSGSIIYGSRGWNASCCGTLQQSVDDIAYIRAVIADVRARFNIDPARVYVEGMSNGAFMAHVLACEASDKIAAIVAQAGTQWTAESEQCQPELPVAVMHIHGTDDATVLYAGGSYYGVIPYKGADATVAGWRERNGCDGAPSTSSFDAVTSLSGDETVVSRWSCGGAPVELWRMEGAEHTPSVTAGLRSAAVDFLFANAR